MWPDSAWNIKNAEIYLEPQLHNDSWKYERKISLFTFLLFINPKINASSNIQAWMSSKNSTLDKRSENVMITQSDSNCRMIEDIQATHGGCYAATLSCVSVLCFCHYQTNRTDRTDDRIIFHHCSSQDSQWGRCVNTRVSLMYTTPESISKTVALLRTFAFQKSIDILSYSCF